MCPKLVKLTEPLFNSSDRACAFGTRGLIPHIAVKFQMAIVLCIATTLILEEAMAMLLFVAKLTPTGKGDYRSAQKRWPTTNKIKQDLYPMTLLFFKYEKHYVMLRVRGSLFLCCSTD